MRPEAIQLLLIEDNPGDARLIARMLSGMRGSPMRMEMAATLAEARQRLEGLAPDAVLLDLSLPDSRGLETFRAVSERVPEVPLVVLSGLDDEEVALRAVQEGAQDYLVKGQVTGELLLRSIRYAIERRKAERVQRESEEKERFRKIFEGSIDAIAVEAVPDGRLLEVNGAFLALFGLAREQALGRSVEELALWAEPAEAHALLGQVRTGQEVRNAELRFRRPDGVAGVALVSLVALDLSGRPCALWFVRDVSEQRLANKALHELSGRLLRAEDEERRRIARELHDGTVADLVALSIDLASLVKATPRSQGKARSTLSEDLALVKQCVRELRTLSYVLHPPLLDEMGLASALRWYTDGFGERSGVRIDLEVPGNLGRLPRELEIALFRIVQEALSNVHRHADSPTASIRLSRDGDRVLVEVTDAGRGIPAGRGEGSGTGVGIPGMRERVQQLGGALQILSGCRGTTVRAMLPLRDAAP